MDLDVILQTSSDTPPSPPPQSTSRNQIETIPLRQRLLSILNNGSSSPNGLRPIFCQLRMNYI